MSDEETSATTESEPTDDTPAAPASEPVETELESADEPVEPDPQVAAESEAAPAASATEATDSENEPSRSRALRKTRVGVVVSDGMSKTIVVRVTRRVPHSRFKKIVKRSTKFYAHDEKGEARVGDKVRIVETRPMSKLKRWRLLDVLAH